MGPTLFLLYIDDLFTLLPPGSAVGYADDVTLVASGDTAIAAAAAQQSLLDIVSRWSCDNVLRLNSVKCTSMCIAPSKRKATSTCAPALNVNGCPISCVLSVKILGVTFTSDLDWRLHAQCVRGKLASKLAVLRRVGSSLNARARRHIYVTCIKPHIEYCLPVWAYCGGEEASIDKLLVRAKCIITNCKSGAVVNDDFNLYSIATFANLRFLSVVCQYFYFVHKRVNGCDSVFSVPLLSQCNKSMSTRASVSNKVLLQSSKHSCENCFMFTAPKLWNSLPNTVTCLVNFNTFYTNVIKTVFTVKL
jgi:hypothetical protein